MPKGSVPTKHNNGLYSSARWPGGIDPDETFTSMCQGLPPMIYFIRCPDGNIKIGWTHGHLDGRMRARKASREDILALTPGSIDDEINWQKRFAEHLIGNEIFRPAPEIFAAINEIRQRMGLSAVAA